MTGPRHVIPNVVRCIAALSVAGGAVPSAGEAQSLRDAVAPLPAPSGEHAVGTTVAYLVDSARRETELPRGRPITLQLFYPTDASGGGDFAPYLMEPGLADALRRQAYYGIDSAAVAVWAGRSTRARLDAPPVEGGLPLVSFSAGLGVARANYTSIAEDLASHGYVVALIDSPFLGTMVLPDGREVIDSSGRSEEPASLRRLVADWTQDVAFVLDRLRSERGPSPLTRVAASIDWSQVGALGHSAGGLVAVASCERDRRVRACVDMDGGLATPDRQPMADFVTTGVRKPTLFLRSQPLYDDTTFARRGITREDWESRGAPERELFAEFVARSAGPIWQARVAGTGHFSFSDAPFVMPWTITRFGGRIIDARRGLRAVTAVVRAFFDRELRGRHGGLSELPAELREVTVVPPAG